MANELKRVGLQLTADGARDFKKELKECSAATKENYSELKLAQSQYDKNTSSTKKLEDRQKYLASQTEVYKDKVSILTAQLKEMESAENRDETAISKKREEVNKAQAKLNDYEKGLEDVTKQIENHSGKLKDWGEKLQNVGGKMKIVGDSMTKYITAPAVAGAAASGAAWKEVDEAYDTLVKKTGATGQELENLKSITNNIATTIPTDFQTVSDAVGEVNTRFGVTGPTLEELSSKFIMFSQLNNTDVSTSIDGVQKALSAYGLSAEDAGGFLDRLNQTGQATGISTESLTNGLVQNAAAFQAMGLNIDQSTILMGQLEKSGANADTVMNGMRKALKEATEQGIPLDQALSNLQNTILNGTGSMDGLTAAYELFGKNGDQIYAAVQNGTIDFNNLGQAAQDVGGNLQTTFDETLSPADNLKTTMNDMKVLGYDIVETSAPMLTEALTILRDIVTDLSEKWKNLDDDQKENVIKFVMLAAAVGPLVSMVGSLLTGLGGLSIAMGALGLPLIAIVPLVIAFVAAIWATYQHVKKVIWIVQNWDKIMAVVKQTIGATVDGLKQKWESFKQKVEEIGQAIVDRWNDMKEKVAQKAQELKDWLGGKFEEIKGLANFVWSLPKLGLDMITSIPDRVRDIVERIKGLFHFDWQLPTPKLPHVQWHWEDVGGVLSFPVFDGIEWYAKAYEKAAYYNTPFIRSDGRGYGDRQGGEFAVGERHLREVIREEAGKKESPVVNFSVNMTINAAAGQNPREIARQVAEELEAVYAREKAVWA